MFNHIREKIKSGTGISQKSIIDANYSIWKISKRSGISRIFKALVKDNATNIDIHSVEKEVKNMIENNLENKKTCQTLDSFFILDIIQAVFSDNNDTQRKELNLDFSHEVSPEQITFSVETPEVYQHINATPVVYEEIDFTSQLVAVKALFMSEIDKLEREKNRFREKSINGIKIQPQEKIICIKTTKSNIVI